MVPPETQEVVFGPSKRAIASFNSGPAWILMEKVKQYPQYDPVKQPDGVINLSGASNNLMVDWMQNFVNKHSSKIPLENVLEYGSISGGRGLLSEMANFFNNHFAPSTPILEENIMAANGVTSLIDLMAWTLCDPTDAIAYLTPTFYMLDFDLTVRSGITTIPISTSKIRDQFDCSFSDALVDVVKEAIHTQAKNGVRCRVLFICNPANPQGRCYPKSTLAALAHFCTQHKMHLVVDEIYAMSQFNVSGDIVPLYDRFSSILSISTPNNPMIHSNVHCLYGMSKDFNMGGLRIAFLVSRDKHVIAAAKQITWFTWITSFSDKFVEVFMSQAEEVANYITLFRRRLTSAYIETARALDTHKIPFQKGNAGLFVFVDLRKWIGYFAGPDLGSLGKNSVSNIKSSREMQLCNFLIRHGVFLNAGEFAGCDQPGHFRLVFTEADIDVVVLAVQRIRNALDILERDNKAPASNNVHNCVGEDDISTLIDENVEDTIEIDGHGRKGWTRVATGISSKVLQILRKANCFS